MNQELYLQTFWKDNWKDTAKNVAAQHTNIISTSTEIPTTAIDNTSIERKKHWERDEFEKMVI